MVSEIYLDFSLREIERSVENEKKIEEKLTGGITKWLDTKDRKDTEPTFVPATPRKPPKKPLGPGCLLISVLIAPLKSRFWQERFRRFSGFWYLHINTIFNEVGCYAYPHLLLLKRLPVWSITYYYSFKIFPRFWLAKSTSLIHHNQLRMTKFERILTSTRKWRQKCSVFAG